MFITFSTFSTFTPGLRSRSTGDGEVGREGNEPPSRCCRSFPTGSGGRSHWRVKREDERGTMVGVRCHQVMGNE